MKRAGSMLIAIQMPVVQYAGIDRKSTRLNSSHPSISYAVFCLKKKKDFLAKLAENDIIEQRTVVFKMDIIDDETISLLLLTDDFETGKNRSKERNNMEHRARKR